MSNFEQIPSNQETPETDLQYVLRMLKMDSHDSAHSAMDRLTEEEEIKEYYDAFVQQFTETSAENNPEGKSREEIAHDDFCFFLKHADAETRNRWQSIIDSKE